MLFLRVAKLIVERSDIENVINDLYVNFNPVKVAVFKVVPIPDRFTNTFTSLSLLNPIVPNISWNNSLSFFINLAVGAYGSVIRFCSSIRRN